MRLAVLVLALWRTVPATADEVPTLLSRFYRVASGGGPSLVAWLA